MRKLNILLAALLAVMLFSSTASAALTYNDAGQVVNDDAVMMLSDLGVISGYPDGSFRPKADLTRAEVAKLLGVIYEKTGRASLLPAAFSDISGNWAEKYILLCAGGGLVSGDGNGSFRPDDPITTAELIKMLLGLLGLEVDSYTGSGWDQRAADKAAELSIYDGYPALTAAVNRDWASRLIYNTLRCGAIRSVDADGGIHYYLDQLDNPRDMIEQFWGAAKYTEVLVANSFADLESDGGCLSSGLTRLRYHSDFKVDTDESYLGRQMSIYTDGEGGIYGLPVADKGEYLITVQGQAQYDRLQRDSSLTIAPETALYINYNAAPLSTLSSIKDDWLVTVIDHNGDKILDVVLVEAWSAASVSSLEQEQIIIESGELSLEIPRTSVMLTKGVLALGASVRYRLVGGRYYIEAA